MEIHTSSVGSDDASPLPLFNLPIILQRLSQVGVPDDNLNEGPRGLVSFAKNHESCLTEMVRAILPAHDEVVDENVFPETMRWLQWLMLEDDPERALACLSSNHQPVALSFRPVLDLLLSYWKDKLMLLSPESEQYVITTPAVQKAAHELTSALVAMLLQYCESNDQNWLCVVSGRLSSSPGLVEVLLRAERVMDENVIAKLHDLLVKLLAESSFRYEFAKAFVVYYPSVINVVIREGNGAALKKYPQLSKFSVLILNMSDLATRLVEEEDLLGVLFQCLENIITSCVAEDRRLQDARWTNCYGTVVRVVEDIRLVMIHSGVPEYLYRCRRDLVTKWISLLASIQKMNSQKPETACCHIEDGDGNGNVQLPVILWSSISDICSLLVAGAFCMSCNEVTKDDLPIPSSALWLISECLQSLQCWLKMDSTTASVHYDDNMLGERIRDLEIVPVMSVPQWPDISYDVSSQLTPVHIPLHRLLSMVLFRSISECYDKSESLGQGSISADRSFHTYGSDFLGQILKECHPYGFSAHVMEHPLRIRVFSALVNAEMNGDVPVSFTEGCRSTKYRSELDKELELFLLQCSAALAPPDCFVQRIVERFGLSHFLSLEFEDRHLRYIRPGMVAPRPLPLPRHGMARVAEMLTLLLQIIKERLQKELIFKLSLPEVPDTASERHARFSEVSASTTKLPRWSNICYPLKGLAKIATCKAFLEMIRAVLFYGAHIQLSHMSDDVLKLALHLLSLALDVCRVHMQSGDTTCHVDGAIPLLAFAGKRLYLGPMYGGISLVSIVFMVLFRLRVSTGDYSSPLRPLILNIISTFVKLEPGLAAVLHKISPGIDRRLAYLAAKSRKRRADDVLMENTESSRVQRRN